MMYRLLVILSLIISLNLKADETANCGDINILANVEDLSKISCHMESKHRKPTQSFCKNCEIKNNIINPEFMKSKAKVGLTIALQKAITQPVLDTFRVGQSKHFNPTACYARSLKDAFKNKESCLTKENKKIIEDFTSKLTLEMARLVDKNLPATTEIQSFFSRKEKSRACSISDAEVLKFENQKKETLLTKENLSKLFEISKKKLDFETIKTEAITVLSPEENSIIHHPVLRNLLINNPERIAEFLKEKKAVNNSDIVKWLNNKENIDLLNTSTNEHCKNAFENFANTLCSADIQSGNVSFDKFNDFEALIDDKYKEHSTALYCSQFSGNPTAINNNITEILKFDQLDSKNLKEKAYTEVFYKEYMESPRKELCDAANQPCTDKKSPQCLLAQDVKEATEKNVSSFDKETIKKLRDILGTDVQADEATRKTLIASGILAEKDFSQTPPTPQTAVAPSPIDPSKEREVMGKVSSPATQVAQPFAGANINPNYSNFNGSSSYTSTTQEETRESYRERGPVLPPSTAEYLKQMSSMNRELLDRLVKERGAKEKYSNDEIKQQIAKLSQERNLPLSPDQQAQFFDHEWSEAAPKVLPLIPEELKAKDKNSDRYAASITAPLTGKALQDKKYQDQRNKALEQFGKGAADNTPVTDPTAVVMSVNNELLLKKVRLDVPDDKIEKLNLSVILDQKLGADKEGKKLKGLIDNKQSFMLDIEGKVAFMVEYSEAKKGFDLKTLKNNLPPEVFEKIKTQLSQFLSKNERKHEYSALKEELKI